MTFAGIQSATGLGSAQLTTILANGQKLGTFLAIGAYAGGPVTGYGVNPKALNQNYNFNKNFVSVCPVLKLSWNCKTQGCQNSLCDN